jgi:16S rRNA (cytosine967-C5)-methyltransferase
MTTIIAPVRRTMTAREVALNVVRDVFGEHPRGAREALDYRLRHANLSAQDRAFATELAYGSIRARRRLDEDLAPFVGERMTTLPKPILEILRLGTYQLRSMPGVEAYAAVSESVGLARRYGHKGTAGLVNAVLRRVASESATLVEGDDDDAIARRASLPTWMVAHWRARFGAALPEIVSGVNAPSAIGLAVDLRTLSVAQALHVLTGAGIAAHASAFAREAVVLAATTPSSELETLGAGRWELQSESACFAVDLLDPQPGERVYEACCGRGNKTLQIVARMNDVGELTACDLDARSIERLRARLAQRATTSVTCVVGDAADAPGDGADVFDRVLVDAPCSGLGIVGHQPEARWRKSPSDAARLAPTQSAILAAAARRVRPGGTLVYAVCSTDAREGDDIATDFLATHNGFRRAVLPLRYAPFTTAAGDVLVPPGLDGRDGFFLATFIREPVTTLQP